MGVQMYTIFGRQVGSHYLALATLGTTGAGIYFAMPSKLKPKDKEGGPSINAASKEEEKFVQDFLDAAASEQKTKT